MTGEGLLDSPCARDGTGWPAARKADATPHASALIESMRDIGYSLETAIADIIDNAITARATRIDILSDTAGERVPKIRQAATLRCRPGRRSGQDAASYRGGGCAD